MIVEEYGMGRYRLVWPGSVWGQVASFSELESEDLECLK